MANNADELEYTTISRRVVHAQIVGLIARQAMAGVEWRDLWSEVMRANNIDVSEVEIEIARRSANVLLPATHNRVVSRKGGGLNRFAMVWMVSMVLSCVFAPMLWVVIAIQVMVALFLFWRSRTLLALPNDFRSAVVVVVCTLLMVGIKLLKH